MSSTIIVHPFGYRCPKCNISQVVDVDYCRGCDECIEREHLHCLSICGYRWTMECADAIPPAPAMPPPPPQASANSDSTPPAGSQG